MPWLIKDGGDLELSHLYGLIFLETNIVSGCTLVLKFGLLRTLISGKYYSSPGNRQKSIWSSRLTLVIGASGLTTGLEKA